MAKRIFGVILGSCLYRFIVAIALRFNVPAECLKLVSSIIVAVAIIVAAIIIAQAIGGAGESIRSGLLQLGDALR